MYAFYQILQISCICLERFFAFAESGIEGILLKMPIATADYAGRRARIWSVFGQRFELRWFGHEQRLGRHLHSQGTICLPFTGRFREFTAIGNWTVRPGFVLSRRSVVAHDNIIGARAKLLVISVPDRHLADRWARQSLSLRAQETAAIMVAQAEESDMARWFARLMAELSCLQPAINWCYRMHLEVEAAIQERRCPHALADYASLSGLSPASLSRTFHSVFGVSFTGFRHRTRVNFAKALLAKGESPAAVAVDAGFSDQAHLCRVFQRYEGQSPGRYRKEPLK